MWQCCKSWNLLVSLKFWSSEIPSSISLMIGTFLWMFEGTSHSCFEEDIFMVLPNLFFQTHLCQARLRNERRLFFSKDIISFWEGKFAGSIYGFLGLLWQAHSETFQLCSTCQRRKKQITFRSAHINAPTRVYRNIDHLIPRLYNE